MLQRQLNKRFEGLTLLNSNGHSYEVLEVIDDYAILDDLTTRYREYGAIAIVWLPKVYKNEKHCTMITWGQGHYNYTSVEEAKSYLYDQYPEKYPQYKYMETDTNQ